MANMMIMRLKVKQVVSLGQNMVRLILTRPSLKSRIEPIPKRPSVRPKSESYSRKEFVTKDTKRMK